MTRNGYLEKHHAICETAIGSIHLMLKSNEPDSAMGEVEIAINELDKLEKYYKENNLSRKIKTVLDSGDWVKKDGLYWNFKRGTRGLNEAFKIVMENEKNKPNLDA